MSPGTKEKIGHWTLNFKREQRILGRSCAVGVHEGALVWGAVVQTARETEMLGKKGLMPQLGAAARLSAGYRDAVEWREGNTGGRLAGRRR